MFIAVLMEVVLYVSGPARFLCLNVASGWNKERRTPEIEAIVTSSAIASILVDTFYPLHKYGYLYPQKLALFRQATVPRSV
jgi:hypothetical protein